MIVHYDAYRGKGVILAPDAYALMVQSINRARVLVVPTTAPKSPVTPCLHEVDSDGEGLPSRFCRKCDHDFMGPGTPEPRS